jgi:hypothetical protein
LLITTGFAYGADEEPFGIIIEQRALDVLQLMFQNMAKYRDSADLQQVMSIKAKMIVEDVVADPEYSVGLVHKIVFHLDLELFKSDPGLVRVNMSSNFGRLEFLVNESESLAVLPDEEVFARVNIPEILSPRIMLPDDDGGLFTLVNLLGGLPFGSLLSRPDGEAGDLQSKIGFVEDLKPSDQRAKVRYIGKNKTEAGAVHVIGVQSILYRQYIKIWVLEDTLELYQISIEDARGTELYLVIDQIEVTPVSNDVFNVDVSGFTEISKQEFFIAVPLKIATATAIEGPIALDLYSSARQVARNGIVIIRTDGFDLQDEEDQLLCEVEYKKPGGTWEALDNIEYAGLPPTGHWDIYFTPDENAQLGMYSFRTRYTDIDGNISEWIEMLEAVEVTPAPPRVVETTPVNGQIRVDISTDVVINFSKPMNRDATEKAFYMISKSGRLVKGTFAWDDGKLTFTPAEELQYHSPYLVRIKGDALDVDGIGLDGDYDMVSNGTPYDDFILTFTTSAAPPGLFFSLREKTYYLDDSICVDIMAKNMTGLHKFSFTITYDPRALTVEDVKEASFVSWKPRPKLIDETKANLWDETLIDDAGGKIIFKCEGTRENGVNGKGYIATIKFKAMGDRVSSLAFSEISLVDTIGRSIEAELDDARIEIVEFHPKDANQDGVVDILDFVEIASSQASPAIAEYALGQNYPNPFNPETWIPYQLERPSQVTINIYRSTGEIIKTLNLGLKEAGFYTDRMKAAYWDGTDNTGQKVSSGVYFYTIQAEGFTATRKMLLCQ